MVSEGVLGSPGGFVDAVGLPRHLGRGKGRCCVGVLRVDVDLGVWKTVESFAGVWLC